MCVARKCECASPQRGVQGRVAGRDTRSHPQYKCGAKPEHSPDQEPRVATGQQDNVSAQQVKARIRNRKDEVDQVT